VTTQLVQVFAREPGAIARARHATAAFLVERGLADRFLVELLVSELVTNAVRHGLGPIRLEVTIVGDHFRVAVTDHGGGRPVLREPDARRAARGGWGLHLVDGTATAWGSDQRPGRTEVWFELPLAANPHPAQPARPARPVRPA
jgi:anti-sigma regulatory factor (Ser/Thr protein kinase)